MKSADRETELLIVGAGPGGYVAAIRAAQLGVETMLVDRDAIGGTCLNYGCIPSKALLTATGRAEAVRDARHMGINATMSIDVERMVDWKDGVVDGLTSGVASLCQSNGVEFLAGEVTFVDETTARVTGEDGETAVSFESAVVATGSRPLSIPNFAFDGERILDSRDALSLQSIPKELVVVGAGYIGMELSTVFARLGADVTVVEMLEEALPGYDEDLTQPVTKRLRSQGAAFQFGEAALEWRDDGDGVTVFTESEDGTLAEYPADRVLVAVGREPVTGGLGLESVSIETNERGSLETDGCGRTDVETVFAIGDVAGEPMLAHKASHEGVVAAETIAGEPVADPAQPVPAVVFTDPEIGTVGATPREAIDEGHDAVVGTFPFSASGRAMTLDETDGFVRIVGNAETGAVLGGQVVGAEAAELLGEIDVAMRADLTLKELAGTVHAHPTLSEAVMEAAAQALGKAIHVGN
jgi:dihydrolipoamide dehydrogenase